MSIAPFVVLAAAVSSPALPGSGGASPSPWVDVEVPARPSAGPPRERIDRLWRQSCYVCHGLEGRGDGPTAKTQDPRPTDFSRGFFKLRTTPYASLPTDEDLFRSISAGIAPSGMPSFADLPAEDRWGLVDHVKRLAVAEKDGKRVGLFEASPPGPAVSLEPATLDEKAVERGAALYRRAGCVLCHGAEGRGEGPQAGTRDPKTEVVVRPVDLTSGAFRGGSGLVDIFRSTTTGFAGTPMLGYADALTPAERWDVAAFVRSLIRTPDPSEPRTVDVAASDRWPFFDPPVVRVRPGDTVRWVCGWRTGVPHTMTAVKGPELFDSGNWCGLWKRTFTTPGVTIYVCSIHPYMKGAVVVGDYPDPVVTHWPPDLPSLPLPPVPGVGELWIDIQWLEKEGRQGPGAVVVVDAATWKTERVIPVGNNPHNLWDTADGRSIVQTSWHSDYISVLDVAGKSIAKSPIEVGFCPAHVAVNAKSGAVYVSMNAEDFVAKIDPSDWSIAKRIRTPLGPHGIWCSGDGKWLVSANTLSHSASIIDCEKDEVVATITAGKLPLGASISPDGKRGYVGGALSSTVTVIDLEGAKKVADVSVGALPIQVVPSPDGRYLFVPNTGSADVSVVDAKSLEVVKSLPSAPGAHGVVFGPKRGGGTYAYVTNKFGAFVTVLDVDRLEVAGQIPMPAGGGNGIHLVPNPYRK